MKTIKCIAVDDEPLALAQLVKYIEKVPFLTLVASCRDAFEAMEILAKELVDVMFIDINMPDLNGLDFVKSLAKKPMVVFTTAYSEYAIEGFKVEAVDYLLKPYSQADLLAAAERVKRRLEPVGGQMQNTEESVEEQVIDDYIFIKSDFRTSKVNVSDILYIEGMSEYVKIFVDGEDKPLMPLLSMRKLEDALPKNRFMRVHRSFIVNLEKIRDISRQRIVFGDVLIPIGDNYKDKFAEYVNKKMMK